MNIPDLNKVDNFIYMILFQCVDAKDLKYEHILTCKPYCKSLFALDHALYIGSKDVCFALLAALKLVRERIT